MEADELDVDELVAERDRLRAELDAVRRRTDVATRLRRAAAPLLVALFAVSLLASGVGGWLHRNTLNGDVWAERVVPLGRDPEVQAALARWTTDELLTVLDASTLLRDALPDRAQVLAWPLSSAVNGWVDDRVQQFFESERFDELWSVAATRAHAAAVDVVRGHRSNVSVEGDRVTIDLIPVINAVLSDVLDRAPALVGWNVDLPEVSIKDIPDAVRDRIGQALDVDLADDFGIITVYDGGTLAGAQLAVRLLDRLVIVTTALTVVTAAGALWVSPRRRRTLLQLFGSAAAVAILIRRATFLVQRDVLALVRVDDNRPAASVVVHTFTDPLTGAAAVALWVIAALVMLVVVTGPYQWVSNLRRTVAHAARSATGAADEPVGDPAMERWIVDRSDALRLAGYVLGSLLLWFVDLSWATFLLVASLVALWQVALHRIAARAGGRGEPGGVSR